MSETQDCLSIHLTQQRSTIVDRVDFTYLMQWKWYFHNGYAVRQAGGRKNKKMILMHRVIMQTPRTMITDHINGDKLDNRRCNLRLCTRKQNQQNQKIVRGGTSKFKGVRWSKRENKWIAKIEQKHLGCFLLETDAALAYNAAAIKYFGEFARLNEVSQ